MQKRVIYHIVFWIGYVLFKAFLNISSELNSPGATLSFPLLKTLISAQLVLLIVKIPMVYILFYITEKYIAKHWNLIKSIFAAFLLFTLSLAAFLPVKQFLMIGWVYQQETTMAATMNFASIISSLFILFFVCGIAMALKLVRSSIKQKETEKEIIKQKLEAELAFLKSQTNPHFLFNTLNNIYALARKKSDDTAPIVMKLSKLLRFMLYESQKSTIPVAKEIQVLDDYIELERIRYTEKLKISFSKNIDNELQPITPLILLPFVENAFKHGASESRFDSYISIALEIQQGHLSFRVDNSKAEEMFGPRPENIGLNNVKRQLELMYPEHSLEINNEIDRFTVILDINLLKHATV